MKIKNERIKVKQLIKQLIKNYNLKGNMSLKCVRINLTLLRIYLSKWQIKGFVTETYVLRWSNWCIIYFKIKQIEINLDKK